MADRDESLDKGDESVTPSTPGEAKAESKAKLPGDLPNIESPSVSPAISEAVPVEQEPVEPKSEPEVTAPRETSLRALVPLSASRFDNEPPFEPIDIEAKKPGFKMKLRHWRQVRLAAAIAIGIGLGTTAGALMSGNLGTPPVDVAAVKEKEAMQQSMAKMSKELTTLKANLDAANKAAQTQAANLDKRINDKVNERVAERLKKEQALAQAREQSDVTGSISPPQTTPAAAPQTFADVPMPKPAPRTAMAQPTQQSPARLPIVRDWSVRGAQNGYVYVQGHRGEIYQVVPGAPLPGLGPVESIRRLDGRWVVTTPKGIIVSMNQRPFFD